MGLVWWIPWLIFYFWWRKRYNIKAKYWEYEMPLMKKNVFITKRNYSPAEFEARVPRKK